MKNFIKKYPKRIIITALVVLLIAVIGTVNNYRTYWDMREKSTILMMKPWNLCERFTVTLQ